MRLVSRLIYLDEHNQDKSLMQFIARRRQPAQGPKSWDEISYDLRDVIGEIVTDGTLRKWAAIYGVPDGGRGITLTQKEYTAGLKASGIVLP